MKVDSFLPCCLPNFIILISLFFKAIAVDVITFEPDGVARLDTMAVYEGYLDRNVNFTSVTLCARIKIFFLHGRDTFFQLHDNQTSNTQMIRGEIFLDKARPVFANRWQFQLFSKKLETFRWYHLCFTYDSNQTLYSTYIDGEKVYSTEYKVEKEIYGDYAFLGQGDYPQQSFSGEITQFNVWKEILAKDKIVDIAKCKLDHAGDYISWNAGWTLNNIESYDVNLKDLCQLQDSSVIFWFSDLFYDEAYYICESLGTHLPTPYLLEHTEKLFQTAEKAWPDLLECRRDFFTPLDDFQTEDVWIRFYDGHKMENKIIWKSGEPNGLRFENCALIDIDGVFDVDCTTYKGCAMCEFKENVIYSLLGACQLEQRNVHFLAHQNNINQITFRGYGDYRIQNTNESWQWLDISRNKVIATMESHKPNFPMGRRNWIVFEEVCKQKPGLRPLLLTYCAEDEYSCDDATCIPLEHRCDLKYDCRDLSDETKCQLVSFSLGYRNDLPPRGNTGSKVLHIRMKILVESVSVDTAQMLIRVSYYLHLSWYDNRVNFVNLKTVSNLNTVTYETFNQLWIPTIGFMNSVGNQHTEDDKEARMFIIKLSNSSFLDNGAAEEVNLFSGKENPFVIIRKYITTFVCNFDLVLYPFDEQMCGMDFQILSASKNFLAFDMNSTVAAYVGSDLLTEYKVGTLKIIQKVEEFSKIRVEIPLKRRSGYAVLNIYIPSFILLIISYVTLYFRPHIFEVRVMASLTTLLVVATLFTQVSTYLPKTSYFKMVDIWLLFCIATIFLIIIFHTLIDVTLLESKILLARNASIRNSKRCLGSSKPFYKKGSSARAKKTIGMLILLSRVIALGLFIIFSLLYWGFILLWN